MTDLEKDDIERALTPADRRAIFRRLGFDLNGGTPGSDGWVNGVLGPSALGEGQHGNFAVNADTGAVKDHGSTGYSGSLYDAVQDVKGLSFPESLRWVAEEAGLSVNGRVSTSGDGQSGALPERLQVEESVEKEPIVSHKQVGRWHTRLMRDTEAAQAARSYLTDDRGISEPTLRGARIGLAHSPDDRRAAWWIMIPVPHRGDEETPPIMAVKGFAFDPSAGDWKRNRDGRKIPRNAGSATLYDLIPSDPMNGPVVLCEGEIDALSAVSHGLNAVTGTSGAATFKSEWARYILRLAPAQEEGVVIAYDGDDAGQEGADRASQTLYEAGLDVRIASLPDGADVNDLLVDGGRDALDAHITQADPYAPSETDTAVPVEESYKDEGGHDLEYDPFPLDALPGPVRAYVRASTRALGEGVPPAMVGVPTLSVLSGAIGDAARLQLKRSWTEPATLWTVLVAPSGTTKSPAFSHAARPVFRRESEARDDHEQALAEWNAQEDPDPQEKPTRKRYRTGDATPEAVVKILEENPRGVLLARDELGAWIGSFDRYVNGAADLQFWVEVWQGVQASRDRAGEGNTTVDTPAVPVTGTIQPGTLKEKLDEIHFDTGFSARLILCQPPTPPKRWTEADVSREVRDHYERLLTRLYSTPRGITASLSPDAKSIWVDYYNAANAELETRPDGPAKAVAAKGITHTARLALVLHLCRKASGETDSKEVDSESMEAALRVGRWLTDETLRVYRMHSLGTKAKPPIRRFLDRLPDRFETSDAKEIAEANDIARRTLFKWLDDLQESGDLEKIKRGLYRKT